MLNYKNRFHLILDAIFRPVKFKQSIELYYNDIIDGIKKDFSDKLDFINYEQYKNGIVTRCDNKHEIAIAQIPIYQKTDLDNMVSVEIFNKKIKQIKISYINENIDINDIKQEVSKILANDLIEKGLIQSKVYKNQISFYINIF